ncbi:exonuclease domain-containing protein [Mycolicibacterium fortuitum]|uniref:exonuclease domain-containing protein n=1 Tax=Mycolicibacterium fortuitum TaxID=1766 RepID=UPI003AACF9B8
MSKRQLIVVDLETTGLNTATCHPLEVAAVNTATGKEIRFVPFISRSALGNADFQALQVNRYFERGSWEDMLVDEGANRVAYEELEEMLTGNTLGGSNPRFDAAVLARFMGEVWHHRLADLAAYAAPAMGLGPEELPGDWRRCASTSASRITMSILRIGMPCPRWLVSRLLRRTTETAIPRRCRRDSQYCALAYRTQDSRRFCRCACRGRHRHRSRHRSPC